MASSQTSNVVPAPLALLMDSYSNLKDPRAPVHKRILGGLVLVAAAVVVAALVWLDVYISEPSSGTLR